MSLSQVEVDISPGDTKRGNDEEKKDPHTAAIPLEDQKYRTVKEPVDECKNKHDNMEDELLKKRNDKKYNKFLKSKLWVQLGYASEYFTRYERRPSTVFDYDPEISSYFFMIVFFIVCICLTLTGGYTAIVQYTSSFKDTFIHARLISLICFCIALLMIDYMFLCIPSSRDGIFSYVGLIIGVILLSNIVAIITLRFDTYVVWLAVGAAAITVFVFLLLALSNFDFMNWNFYIVGIVSTGAALAIVLCVAIYSMNLKMDITAICITCVIAEVYIIIMVTLLQMVLSGGTVWLAEDHYAFGAYMLYMCPTQFILQLLLLIQN